MFFYSLLRACLLGCLLCTRHAKSAAACYYHSRTLPRSMYGHLGAYNPTKNAAYLFGGASGDSNGVAVRITSVYKWDLNSPTSWFTQIGSIPSSAANLFSWIGNGNVAMVGNKAYLVGVADINSGVGTGKIYVFDTDTEQWLDTDQISLPPVRLLGCVASTATHIFMADGTDIGTTNRKPYVHVYDIAGDSWTSQLIDDSLSLSGGWAIQYCSVVGDALYILGGTEGAESSLDTALSLIYRINTLTLQVEKASATLSPGQAFGVGINHENLIYLVGAFPYRQEIVAFDTATGSVSTAFTTQESFSSAVVLKINNKIYRFGGARDYVSTDTVEICDLPTNNPTMSPSQSPSFNPSQSPTVFPSQSPTRSPSSLPTLYPSTDPSTSKPTDSPSTEPTLEPTRIPYHHPSDPTTSRPTLSAVYIMENSPTPPTSSLTPTEDQTKPPTATSRAAVAKRSTPNTTNIILTAFGVCVLGSILVLVVWACRKYRVSVIKEKDDFERADGKPMKKNGKYNIGFFSPTKGADKKAQAVLAQKNDFVDDSDKSDAEVAQVQLAPVSSLSTKGDVQVQSVVENQFGDGEDDTEPTADMVHEPNMTATNK